MKNQAAYIHNNKSSYSTLKDFIPAISLLLLSSIYFGYLYFRPPEMARQLAVLFPPHTSFEQIHSYLEEIDASLVRMGLWENLVVIDLGSKLDTKTIEIPGAILLLDAVTTGGCFF